MSDEGAAARLLEHRPDLAGPLETVLDVDEKRDTWTYDDVPINSGPFGELVNSGVVESVGDEYRVADPAATRIALGHDTDTVTSTDSVPALSVPSLEVPSIDRTTTAIVGAALVFVGLVRSHTVRSVYRDGQVVLPGNDPYYYRYWIEQAAASDIGLFDPTALTSLPGVEQTGEPLLIVTLWWFTQLLGGSQAAIDTVLVWFPVVYAVITAGFVYLLAVALTDDRRVGVASVLMLALLPGHALRTSLGYADHHALDYLLLAATAYLLVLVVTTDREDLASRRTWLVSAAFGTTVATQVLAWDVGPLLIAPIGFVVVAKSLVDVDAGRSPLVESVPIVGGLVLAATLTLAAHLGLGWHGTFPGLAPTLLLLGSVGALVLAEAIHRTTADVRHLAAGNAVALIVGVLGVRTAVPDFWATLDRRVEQFFGREGIAETLGLFNPDSFGFLFLFGFTLVLALPVMAVAVRWAVDDDRWLVGSVYVWFFFLLSMIQVRFVGEFAPFAAVFAGFGLVWMAAWIDAAGPIDDAVQRLHIPDRTQLGTLVLLFLLVTSLGIVQVPVKTAQLTIEDDTFDTAQYIADHADELDQEYPDNKVFSDWGRNRVYNYYVSGESERYRYAQDNFRNFINDGDPDGWYDRLSDHPIGYVVISTTMDVSDETTANARLADTYGSDTGGIEGTGHFRALYLPPGESQVAFSVVPGATVAGTAPANSTVTLATNASIPRAEFTYERQTTANASGEFDVRVAQPGTYDVETEDGTQEVTVSEEAVRNGTRVSS